MKPYPEYQFNAPADLFDDVVNGNVAIIYDDLIVERMPGYPCQVKI